MAHAVAVPTETTTVPRRFLVGVLVVSLLVNLAFLVDDLVEHTFLNAYNATQYYLTWQDGFFRRGLPGTLVHLVMGRDPSLPELAVVTAVVTVLGMLALLALVLSASRLPAFAGAEGVVLTLLLVSPLTFSMVLHNRSRLDPMVVVFLALLALLPGTVLRSRWLSSVLAAGLGAAAVGSLEFAIGFVIPVLIARALREQDRTLRIARFAVEVVPGLALAAASLLIRPSAETIGRVADRFASAGVEAPRQNSVSVLTNSMAQEVALNANLGLASRLACWAVFAACFVVTLVLLRRLGTWDASTRRPYAVFLFFCVATAAGLTVIGFDYGRWFALTFLGVVASVVALAGRPSTPLSTLTRTDRPFPRRTVLLLAAVLVICLVGQQFPIWPAWDTGAHLPSRH